MISSGGANASCLPSLRLSSNLREIFSQTNYASSFVYDPFAWIKPQNQFIDRSMVFFVARLVYFSRFIWTCFNQVSVQDFFSRIFFGFLFRCLARARQCFLKKSKTFFYNEATTPDAPKPDRLSVGGETIVGRSLICWDWRFLVFN